jgi:hypothetical protein
MVYICLLASKLRSIYSNRSKRPEMCPCLVTDRPMTLPSQGHLFQVFDLPLILPAESWDFWERNDVQPIRARNARIVKCVKNVLWASAKGVPWQCQSVLMSNCGSRCTLTEASFETSTRTFASVIRLMSFHSVFKSQSSHSSGFRNVYTYVRLCSKFILLCLHECKIVQVCSMHCIRSLTWDCEYVVPIIGPHLALPSPRCHLVESFVLKMATCHFSVMCSAYTTCCLINIYIYIHNILNPKP